MFEIETNIILFLAVVAFGAVVQTITGFAMGLVTLAGITAMGVADIAFTAAVVSFISMANTGIGLLKGYRQVDWRYIRWIGVTFLPSMAGALALLTYLSEHYYDLLKFFLGLVIILAGSMLMISPRSYAQKSSRFRLAAVGVLGRAIGGLYSAWGGPVAYLMYRQPIDLKVIRFSLLAVIGFSTLARSFIISVSGQMSRDILLFSAVSIPLVIVVTLWVSHYLHYIPDKLVCWIVNILLLGVGGFLILASIGY